MDKETKLNIRLGLFVAIGIVIFIVGIFLVGARNGMFTKSFTIKAYFTNTSGLKPGGNVRYDGVKVGIVKTVKIINDSTVEVIMSIDESKHEFITKSATATIASDGLMGDKLVNIMSGIPNSPQTEEGDVIKTKKDINMDAMLEKLGGTSDNINVITDNLKNITSDLNSKKGAIQSLYKDTSLTIELRQTFANLNTMSLDVKRAGQSIEQITSKMQNGKGAISEVLNDTALGRNLVKTISNLKETSEKLSAASDQVNLTMRRVNSPNGPVNTLLTDTSLSNNIKQSAVNIKKASERLDEDLEGLQHSFLLKGYFKKKDKDSEQK